MEWSNILNYGKGNYYNFEKMKGNIVSINALNGMGKSNFFEIIYYGIFGDQIKSRKTSKAIININKGDKEEANI